MYHSAFTTLLTLALAVTTNAHSLILNVDGANGNSASGFGVVQSTPRNGRDEVSTVLCKDLIVALCKADFP